MTILTDEEIRVNIEGGFIGLSPYDPEMINPNSIDVTLGNHFIYYTENTVPIDVFDPRTINYCTESVKTREWLIEPGQFLLATTRETVTLPSNIVASIEGKSSLARIGLSIHVTGGWIDSGFSGKITLEMFNANVRPIRLVEGMRIGQIVFFKTGMNCKLPYNLRPNSKYNGQNETTLSKYNKNNPKNWIIGDNTYER
jgi:dCTP deaminase